LFEKNYIRIHRGLLPGMNPTASCGRYLCRVAHHRQHTVWMGGLCPW